MDLDGVVTSMAIDPTNLHGFSVYFRPPGAHGGLRRPRERILGRLTNTFRFLGFWLWFVLGSGGLREVPDGPGDAHGAPGARATNLRNHVLSRALRAGQVSASPFAGRRRSERGVYCLWRTTRPRQAVAG